MRRLIGRRAGLLLLRLTELRAQMRTVVVGTSVFTCMVPCVQLENIRKAVLQGMKLLRSVSLPETLATLNLWMLQQMQPLAVGLVPMLWSFP